MRDILVADYMPGGYTQAITVGLENVTASSREVVDNSKSQLNMIIREVALRALCLVAAAYITCLNVIMALPYYAIAISKCVQNRQGSPDLAEGIACVIGLTTVNLLINGMLTPFVGALLSPDLPYGRTGRQGCPALRNVNAANMGIQIETSPELYVLLGNALGVNLGAFRNTMNLPDWRHGLERTSFERYAMIPFDQAAAGRDDCDEDHVRVIAQQFGTHAVLEVARSAQQAWDDYWR